jgi:hypothetical protein
MPCLTGVASTALEMNESNLTRRAVTTGVAAIACDFTPGLSFANDSTPIKIAVGFPPGGSGDLLARILAAARQHCPTAQLMSTRFGCAIASWRHSMRCSSGVQPKLPCSAWRPIRIALPVRRLKEHPCH